MDEEAEALANFIHHGYVQLLPKVSLKKCHKKTMTFSSKNEQRKHGIYSIYTEGSDDKKTNSQIHKDTGCIVQQVIFMICLIDLDF